MVKRESHIEKIHKIVKEYFDKDDSIWENIDIGTPISTNVRYLYPRSEMETTRVYRLSETQRKKQRQNIILPTENNYKITSIQNLENGVSYTASAIYHQGESLILNPTCFSDDSELYMVVTTNNVPYDFLKTLIDLRVSEVSSREDSEIERHWIVAAIKDDTIFTPLYSKVSLDDVNIDVGIQVGKHYSTILQGFDTPLLRLIRANQDILKAIDTGNRDLLKVSRRIRKNIQEKEMKRRKDNIYSVLSNLCLPNKFKNYLTIDNSRFSLVDSRRSENLLTLSDLILPIPSGMNVSLFTTLDETNLVQKGNILFHRNTFQTDIEKILRNFYKLK